MGGCFKWAQAAIQAAEYKYTGGEYCLSCNSYNQNYGADEKAE